MQPKKYALTQLGNPNDRNPFVLRDANCPIITHVRKRNSGEHVAVASWLVNLCEDGCLIASDYFPKKVHDVYIVIPGLGAKLHGKATKQGQYSLKVQFTTLLTAGLVDKVGRIKVVARA